MSEWAGPPDTTPDQGAACTYRGCQEPATHTVVPAYGTRRTLWCEAHGLAWLEVETALARGNVPHLIPAPKLDLPPLPRSRVTD